jgi:hypothetical protein
MSQNFQPGDYLVFQLEAGYALLRLLGTNVDQGDTIWHLSAYSDFFADIESAEAAINARHTFSVSIPHAALTNRAFESTQVARLSNVPLTEAELSPLATWSKREDREVSDRSIRLMMGFR